MSLELKKMQVELLRVNAAKAELELKIEEQKENIKRIEDHIVVQEKRAAELEIAISKLLGENNG